MNPKNHHRHIVLSKVGGKIPYSDAYHLPYDDAKEYSLCKLTPHQLCSEEEHFLIYAANKYWELVEL